MWQMPWWQNVMEELLFVAVDIKVHIEEGPLGLDKVMGKSKGFCLFVYKTLESAKKSLEEPYKIFEDMLHCQKAIDGPKPWKSQHSWQQKNAQTL
ncbi:hypothetical protein SAY87_016545 [Trapa incisa]|uniref:Uncharacterized protein n=1 Tax=Trapa incisa TaxID=236973 RepID=A0AAN7QUG0_9MYRT|nr:hypothetical protein SAY87_016545 [Trapa incisa]